MANGGKVTVDVDVVIRSVRFATDPLPSELPGVVELAHAMALAEGMDWENLNQTRQAGYATRANELRYILANNGQLPTTVCLVAIPGLRVGNSVRPLLVCDLTADHPGPHRTSDGCMFDLTSVTT